MKHIKMKRLTHPHTENNVRNIGELVKSSNLFVKTPKRREFPGGPVVRALRFHCRGHGFDPWLGN